MKEAKLKKGIFLAIKYLVSLLLIALVLGPILVTLFTSVKTAAHMVTTSPIALPPLSEITFENYGQVFGAKLLPDAFKNTFIILVVSVVLNVLLGSITAYVISRFQFRFKKAVTACFYLGMLVPTFIVEIARFHIISGLGLYNTLGAPIIIYVASDLMQLFIYMQFIGKISPAIDESALIDGAGYFRIFYRIIFPLLLPATATVVIVKMVNIINDMYIPYLYMPATRLKTLTTFLMNYASSTQGSWQVLSAAIVVVLVPALVLYLLFSRQIVEGLSAGAIKE